MAVAADTVYFAILADRHTSSPTGIARRRLDAGEAIEETWTRATRWTPNKVVTRFYLKPDPDDEVAMITESEAWALLEWFQQRDGSPPFPGGPLVNAWEIIFIGSTAARELLIRLRLDQHGTVPFSGGLALGLRVLHTGTFGRAALTLHQFLRDAWAVSIEQFGTAPSPTLVEQVRAEVLAAIVDLPVSVVREKYPSASIGRWNEPRGWSSAAHYGLVLQITARGALTGEAISELRAQLHCVDDRDVDSDTDHGRRPALRSNGRRPLAVPARRTGSAVVHRGRPPAMAGKPPRRNERGRVDRGVYVAERRRGTQRIDAAGFSVISRRQSRIESPRPIHDTSYS
jgi:hypothetical protein